MLAIAGVATYLFHQYNKKAHPETDQPVIDYRAKAGTNGFRSFTKTAPERALPKIPAYRRTEQPPEVRRRLPNENYREPAELTRARLDRLYEAQSDGPFYFVRGKVDKDRSLIANRVPHHHPGLTKVGVDENEYPYASERPAPLF